MEKKPILSAYKIYWAEFTPTTGKIVTKHDMKRLDPCAIGFRLTSLRRHFPSKQKALDFLSGFDKKLDKRYAVRLFSDKQFSLAKESEGYAIPYTKKQLNEVYYVG